MFQNAGEDSLQTMSQSGDSQIQSGGCILREHDPAGIGDLQEFGKRLSAAGGEITAVPSASSGMFRTGLQTFPHGLGHPRCLGPRSGCLI